MSKFHALNFKLGSLLPFWTLLKKVHNWRKKYLGEGAVEVEVENPGQDDDKQKTGDDNSIEALLKQLSKLQKNQHTLDLACSIFSDSRVRQLGWMLLV